MWWDDQNLDRPRKSKAGTTWHFRVWHDVIKIRTGRRTRLEHVARVYFWDSSRRDTGVVIFSPHSRTDASALHVLIDKLLADSKLRERHSRPLTFPLEQHYSEHGSFPEESAEVAG